MLPLVTSIGVCPVDMGVDCDEVVTSTETCPVDMVVSCDEGVTSTVDILTKVVVWRLVCPGSDDTLPDVDGTVVCP